MHKLIYDAWKEAKKNASSPEYRKLFVAMVFYLSKISSGKF